MTGGKGPEFRSFLFSQAKSPLGEESPSFLRQQAHMSARVLKLLLGTPGYTALPNSCRNLTAHVSRMHPLMTTLSRQGQRLTLESEAAPFVLQATEHLELHGNARVMAQELSDELARSCSRLNMQADQAFLFVRSKLAFSLCWAAPGVAPNAVCAADVALLNLVRCSLYEQRLESRMQAVAATGTPAKDAAAAAERRRKRRQARKRRQRASDASELSDTAAAAGAAEAEAAAAAAVADDEQDEEIRMPVQSKIRAPLFAARTLNATGQSRVTLSLR